MTSWSRRDRRQPATFNAADAELPLVLVVGSLEIAGRARTPDEMTADGEAALRAGVRAEVFTVCWMIIEAAVAMAAGIAARSVLLTAFGEARSRTRDHIDQHRPKKAQAALMMFADTAREPPTS